MNVSKKGSNDHWEPVKFALGESVAFINSLREDSTNYDVDEAETCLEAWLTRPRVRGRLEEAYGQNLVTAIGSIEKALKQESLDLDSFQKAFRGLAYATGPNRIELCVAAVTPSMCTSD